MSTDFSSWHWTMSKSSPGHWMVRGSFNIPLDVDNFPKTFIRLLWPLACYHFTDWRPLRRRCLLFFFFLWPTIPPCIGVLKPPRKVYDYTRLVEPHYGNLLRVAAFGDEWRHGLFRVQKVTQKAGMMTEKNQPQTGQDRKNDASSLNQRKNKI